MSGSGAERDGLTEAWRLIVEADQVARGAVLGSLARSLIGAPQTGTVGLFCDTDEPASLLDSERVRERHQLPGRAPAPLEPQPPEPFLGVMNGPKGWSTSTVSNSRPGPKHAYGGMLAMCGPWTGQEKRVQNIYRGSRRPVRLTSSSQRRVVLVSNYAPAVVNFRGSLISALVDSGASVYVLAPDYNANTRQSVLSLGAEPVQYSLDRTGMNPLRDAVDILRLAAVLRRIGPDVMLSYTIKPVIYGSLAGRLVGVPKRFSLIPGLGYAFTRGEQSESLRHRWLRATAQFLYAISLRFNNRVFFQNQDDIEEFLSLGLVRAEQVVSLPGTGVDLTHFHPVPVVTNPVTFLLVARMLKEKGVYEFVTAARIVRRAFPNSRFLLVGGVDANPGSISESQIRAWVAEGLVEWPGQVDDVRPWIERASVFVLPSSYREGKPRSTQEAMAMGRPVITTEVPGCRETVRHNRNGFLVPARNPEALAEAMLRFIERPELIERMGRESRRMAEEMFDVRTINQRMLEVMGIEQVYSRRSGSSTFKAKSDA